MRDMGRVAEDPINISNNNDPSIFFRSPQIVSSGDNVYAVWIQSITAGGTSIDDVIFWPRQETPTQIECSDLTLKPGVWKINGNGFIGDLDIGSINNDGTLAGTLTMRNEPTHEITGFWDDISKKITFIRAINLNDPSSFQIYTGYLFCNPGVYSLAGSFEAFAGSGASAQRSIYGWYALLSEGGS